MRQTRKSSLFLIELIIAILLFSLSSAVCVTLFSVSHMKTKESEYRTTAILEAQSVAEIFRNDEGDMTALITMTGAVEIEENQYLYYLDEGGDYLFFDESDVGNEVADIQYYEVVLKTSGADNLPAIEILITPPNDGETIVELQTQIYVSMEKEDI